MKSSQQGPEKEDTFAVQESGSIPAPNLADLVNYQLSLQ